MRADIWTPMHLSLQGKNEKRRAMKKPKERDASEHCGAGVREATFKGGGGTIEGAGGGGDNS